MNSKLNKNIFNHNKILNCSVSGFTVKAVNSYNMTGTINTNTETHVSSHEGDVWWQNLLFLFTYLK